MTTLTALVCPPFDQDTIVREVVAHRDAPKQPTTQDIENAIAVGQVAHSLRVPPDWVQILDGVIMLCWATSTDASSGCVVSTEAVVECVGGEVTAYFRRTGKRERRRSVSSDGVLVCALYAIAVHLGRGA